MKPVSIASTSGITPRFIELAERGLLVLPEREPSHEWLRGRLPRLRGGGPDAGSDAVDALLRERRGTVR